MTNTDNCSADATCADMTPGFTCTCNSGYSGDGETCTSKGTPLHLATNKTPERKKTLMLQASN